MRRNSILTFVAIYALVVAVGYFASGHHDAPPAHPSPTGETPSALFDADGHDRKVSAIRGNEDWLQANLTPALCDLRHKTAAMLVLTCTS